MLSLQIKNLTFSFREGKNLFQNLSFSIEPGRCLLLKGPNGSGKSTLIRLIAGLERLQQGEIFLQDKSQTFYRVFSSGLLSAESGGFFLGLSALANMRFWMGVLGQSFSREKFFEAAKKWGFHSSFALENLPVQRFSTGMKRKLALMRAFQGDSSLLLLDEPLNGLDQKSCEIFFEELAKAKREKKMILMTSHQVLGPMAFLVDQELTVPTGELL